MIFVHAVDMHNAIARQLKTYTSVTVYICAVESHTRRELACTIGVCVLGKLAKEALAEYIGVSLSNGLDCCDGWAKGLCVLAARLPHSDASR